MRKALALRPYQPGDGAMIAAREDFRRQHEAMGWPLAADRPDGLIWTMTRDGEPYACGGARERGDGVWEGWLYCPPFRRAEWGFLLGCVARVLRVLDSARARRIEATVAPDAAPAERLLRRFGFRTAGVCQPLGPEGGAYLLMARGR